MTTKTIPLVLAAVLLSTVVLVPADASNAPPAEVDRSRTKALFTTDPPADIAAWATQFGWAAVLQNDDLDLVAFQLVEGIPGDQFLQELRGRSDVRWASYDGIARTQHVRDPLSPNPPNDARGPGQYALRLVGLSATGPLNDAWDHERGDATPGVGPVIAILDTGVYSTHEDLAKPCTPLCASAPGDVYGHGTHVAGIAAAEANNDVGIVGVAQVRIASYKALMDNGQAHWSVIADAISRASLLGGRVVISMSLGGGCHASDASYICRDLEDAIIRADLRGHVLVAASGNNWCVGEACVVYPARYTQVVAVGSVGAGKARSASSNGGPELDLVAPGEHIDSTVPPMSRMCGSRNPPYCTASGTSMAAPHVSGVAALVWSHCVTWTNAQVVAHLKATAEDLGDAGADWSYGNGLVRADTAFLNAHCAL